MDHDGLSPIHDDTPSLVPGHPGLHRSSGRDFTVWSFWPFSVTVIISMAILRNALFDSEYALLLAAVISDYY